MQRCRLSRRNIDDEFSEQLLLSCANRIVRLPLSMQPVERSTSGKRRYEASDVECVDK